jgi:bifunctional enzyme CysN/CysC
VWLTGLPASGKSSIGAAVEERLVEGGRYAYLLDGDNLRHGICGDLGFTTADRERNVLRVGELAWLLADAGAVVVVALVSPFAGARDAVRHRHEQSRLPFYEVHVDTPLEVCIARDPKGLYAQAQAGELPDFTGIGQAYEPPGQPELRLPDGLSVAAAADAVLALLR